MSSLLQKFDSVPTKYRLFLLLVVVTFVGYSFWLRPQSSVPLSTPKEQEDLQTEVSASGKLVGKQVANLKFKAPGKLATLKVKEGDLVSAGALIASLDSQELTIRLQQAQNSLRDKQAAVERALDEVKDHGKDETYSQKATRTAAEAARDNAYDSVREARRAFQDITIYSPIAGSITSQSEIVVGQNITATDLIAQVTDFSEKVFLAEVDESDITKVKLGQRAEVGFNAYSDQIFTGVVSKISSHTKTASSGATVVEVEITLDRSELQPISGLNGTVSIITSEAKS